MSNQKREKPLFPALPPSLHPIFWNIWRSNDGRRDFRRDVKPPMITTNPVRPIDSGCVLEIYGWSRRTDSWL